MIRKEKCNQGDGLSSRDRESRMLFTEGNEIDHAINKSFISHHAQKL